MNQQLQIINIVSHVHLLVVGLYWLIMVQNKLVKQVVVVLVIQIVINQNQLVANQRQTLENVIVTMEPMIWLILLL